MSLRECNNVALWTGSSPSSSPGSFFQPSFLPVLNTVLHQCNVVGNHRSSGFAAAPFKRSYLPSPHALPPVPQGVALLPSGRPVYIGSLFTVFPLLPFFVCSASSCLPPTQ